ncbi:MAG: flagellar biosynthesis anti-sigma factor FlgM [Legionellaceae bacterium]|nr:flagellar biosynthesis anti-sigma factor FlgM [Legionellaceae bacterium]
MVNSIQNSNGIKPTSTEHKSASKAQDHPTAASPAEDKVDLHVHELRETILTASEINHARVAFLQKELASGRYQMDSLVIADKLLAEFDKNR